MDEQVGDFFEGGVGRQLRNIVPAIMQIVARLTLGQ